ncbi:TetR/AcrR family transcriptional regulator [Lysinimonas soli]|uniref:TetR/AcrR family transcriptional regulator n=1 Tax=Lysinimonas soli TaxID=1074233 RepID=A0ABW0NTP2_9MICO
MGDLLERQGLDFTLPDLARESGVATATVYRHFDDMHELRAEFYNQIVDDLLDAFRETSRGFRGIELFRRIGEAWLSTSRRWVKAATFIRSAEGFLQRVNAGDPLSAGLHEVLAPVIQDLIDDGVIPPQDLRYAVLIWTTLFDERIIVDLRTTLEWSEETVAGQLGETVLAALRAPKLPNTESTP